MNENCEEVVDKVLPLAAIRSSHNREASVSMGVGEVTPQTALGRVDMPILVQNVEDFEDGSSSSNRNDISAGTPMGSHGTPMGGNHWYFSPKNQLVSESKSFGMAAAAHLLGPSHPRNSCQIDAANNPIQA